MFSAGRVLLMPKGAYNPLTTYEMLDIVSYNGSSYIAKGTTTGNLPTDGTYWQLSAYGGQAANIAGNFAELESSSVATATHYVDDIFVDENSQLMKATQTINIGDTIDENVNCTPTTVEALISYLSSYVDSLDSLNKKIQGAIEIAAQTDLHSLAIGEYYKKQSTFYVTNGPTGIDQDPTAIFRLTVEAALDNASQASSPLLLTLRTPDGKIYTQSFDGTNWGSWVEVASAASVSALNTAKQPKTLDTPITVGGVQQTTVEGALGSINQTLTQNVNNAFDVMSKNGAKNLLPISLETYKKVNSGFTWNANVATINGLTITFNEDGTFVINNTSSNYVAIKLIPDAKGSDLQWLNGKKYSGITTGSTSTYMLRVSKATTPWTTYGRVTTGESIVSGIPNNDDLVSVDMYIFSGQTFDNLKVKPMVTLASDINGDYEPYSMTNQELTPIAQAVSNRNLLDNPWFTVNQRGQSSYSGNVYTVDRWHIQANMTLAKSDDAITISSTNGGNFYQILPISDFKAVLGKTITISIMLSDGTIKSVKKTLPSTLPSTWTSYNDTIDGTIRLGVMLHPSYFQAFIGFGAGDSISIKAIKVELGSVSTLAQDTAPNYQQELAKCQRYFQRINVIGFGSITGILADATTARIPLKLEPEMRTGPSVTISDVNNFIATRGFYSDATALSALALQAGSNTSQFVVLYATLTTAKNAFDPIFLGRASDEDTAYIDLSADL